MSVRFGAIERGDLQKHGPHLLLQIAELHKVSLSLDFCSVIHSQYAAGMRSINGSWVEEFENSKPHWIAQYCTGRVPSEIHTEALCVSGAAEPVNQSHAG